MNTDEKLVVKGVQIDQPSIEQMRRTLTHPKAIYGVLMADHHKGYGVPIGGVVAYKDAVSPTGVGYDIACGVLCAQTPLKSADVFREREKAEIAREIAKRISFGVGRTNRFPVWTEKLEGHPAWKIPAVRALKRRAKAQLGTVGSGNHYIDLLTNEEGFLCVATHFGSRGLGHGITSHYLKMGGAKSGMDVEPLVLEKGHAQFDEYLSALDLGGMYAYAGRDWVIDTIVKEVLGTTISHKVHNHHNYAWRENHFGEDFYVVRKGATPAFPAQAGFVGANMRDTSVILYGVDSEESKRSLYSTVHGAGRIMSRTQAKKTIAKLDDVRQSVYLWGGGTDEHPKAYKNLDQVLEAHKGTIVVAQRLTPEIVMMAGKHEYDPYKD